MKYIIIPTLKILWVLSYILLFLPLAYIFCLVVCLWELNFKSLIGFHNTPYAVQDEVDARASSDILNKEFKYYSYPTVFDWFLNRKIWHK